VLTLLLLLTLTASDDLAISRNVGLARGGGSFHAHRNNPPPLWRPPLTVRVVDASPRKGNISRGPVLPGRELAQSVQERTRRTRMLNCLTGGPETLDGILAALECKNDRDCRQRACRLQEETP